MSTYRELGFVCVEWFDACQWERVGSLDECRLILQKSVGYGYANKRDKTIIVVFSAAEEFNHFDALVIPECWIWDIKQLKEVKDAKRRAKKVD